MANYLTSYVEQAKERQTAGVEPLALNAEFTKELVSLLKTPPVGSENDLLHLLKDRINPGVDESSKIKADFLYEIAIVLLNFVKIYILPITEKTV